MEIVPIILFCFSTSITPGPNNIMLMSSGVNYGVKKSIPHLLGITIGFPLMIVAIGLGFGSLLLSFPAIYPIIKTLGVLYLLYLAWKIANSSAPKTAGKTSSPLTFLQAVLFQWVNPKAWVMAMGAIAAFTNPENFILQLALILTGYMTVGALSMVFWLTVGVSLKKLIHRDSHLKYFNITMAVLLVLSLIPMVFSDFDNI